MLRRIIGRFLDALGGMGVGWNQEISIMVKTISMTHVEGRRAAVLGLLALLAVPFAAPAVSAQDRGEEIL